MLKLYWLSIAPSFNMEKARERGLKISTTKTDVMGVYNNINITQIKIGIITKQTTKFCYLGSIVNCDGGCYDDIKNQINEAKASFNNHLPRRNSKKLQLMSKIRISKSNVKSVLLYGSK
jgi:hypothetical protein